MGVGNKICNLKSLNLKNIINIRYALLNKKT